MQVLLVLGKGRRLEVPAGLSNHDLGIRFRCGRARQITRSGHFVDFDQCDTGQVAHAADFCGVGPGFEGDQ